MVLLLASLITADQIMKQTDSQTPNWVHPQRNLENNQVSLCFM